MSWDEVTGALNAACLSTFGRQLPTSRGGRPCRRHWDLETGAPRERAQHLRLLFLKTALCLRRRRSAMGGGDDGGTYKVFEIEADAGGGVKLAASGFGQPSWRASESGRKKRLVLDRLNFRQHQMARSAPWAWPQ
jgi:hypothetical protein